MLKEHYTHHYHSLLYPSLWLYCPMISAIHLQDIVRYCIGCYSRTCGQSRSRWSGDEWTPLFMAAQEVALSMALQQLIDGECVCLHGAIKLCFSFYWLQYYGDIYV